MRIILDQDNVICQWVERIIQYWNEDNGTNLTPEDITGWNVEEGLGGNDSSLVLAGKHFVRSCCRYPEFYRDLDPVPGAIAGTKKLLDAGHDVIIATASPNFATVAYTGKVEWLRRQMPFFPLKNLVVIQRKTLLYGDILLDDGAHNIVPWTNTNRIGLVYDAAWNRKMTGHVESLTHRVKGWDEVIDTINTLDEMSKIQQSRIIHDGI